MNNIKKEIDNAALNTDIVIDSTASIETILRNFIKRETYSKVYKYYNQLVVPKRSANARYLHYTQPGHPLKVFRDGWDGDIQSDYFENFQYRSTMPKVVSQLHNIEQSDPVVEYMKIKNDWKASVTERKNVPGYKIETLNDDVIKCPQFMVDLAAGLENEPIPYFDSPYNWCYSGNGNMQLICINGIDYLLHSEFSTVYLTRLHKDTMTLEHNKARYNCDDNHILETVCSSENIVVLRTMHEIIILKVVEKETLCFEKLKQFQSDSQFTGISFDQHHTNILYVTTLNSKLSIVNIDRMTARSVNLHNNSNSLVNNWNTVIGSERVAYLHIERAAITMYDKRTNNKVFSWTRIKDIVDQWCCNDITAAKLCTDSPAMYFTTDHHAFQMDIRYSTDTKLNPVLRWMLCFKSAPTYLSVGKASRDKELLCISSQWCEDACVISNYANSVTKAYDMPGVSMPYHPPHIMNVLNAARQKMLCVNIQNPIDGRLATSITGQVVVEHDENSLILTHNALGDIFCRTLYPQYMESFIEDKSIQQLHDWSQSYKLEKKDFDVSAVVNIAKVWKKLKKVPDNYHFGGHIKEFDESNVYELYENEQLEPEFLKAWAAEGNDDIPMEHSTSPINFGLEMSDSE